jgi:hypothetical protein
MMMSNPESLPENTADNALTLNYLNMQLEKLKEEQALQTQKLTELVEAIEQMPDAPAWSQQRVRIADFNMPFWNLVGFMVKAAIAFIPAAIILFILSVCVLSTFGTAFLSALLKSAR